MAHPVLLGDIQTDSKLPLHYQLLMIIKRSIASHNIKAGDQIPTEEELCAAFGVSRSTVRSALAALEEDGLINRVRGKGTFISKSKLKRKMEQVYSFSHEMDELGLEPTSKLLDFRKEDATEDLSLLFKLNPGEKVFRITRLRLAAGEPLLLETSFLPVKICEGLTGEMLKHGSLYDILRDEAKVVPYIAEETYESIVLEEKIASLLECPPGSSGFYVERETRLISGETYELTQSFTRGDRVKIVVTLQQDIHTVSRNVDAL